MDSAKCKFQTMNEMLGKAQQERNLGSILAEVQVKHLACVQNEGYFLRTCYYVTCKIFFKDKFIMSHASSESNQTISEALTDTQ